MRGLKYVIQKLVKQREKMHEFCMTLLDEYGAVYLLASKTKDYGDPFLKELRKHKNNRLVDFKREDRVPKARKKFSRKFPLALGASCLIYSIIVLLFVNSKLSCEPLHPPASPSPNETPTEHTLLETVGCSLESSHRIPRTEATGSKILYVNNLASSVTRADVENFFGRCGKIVNVGFAFDKEGLFNGFGHVEFATVEAVQIALILNGQEFFGHEIRLDLSQDRGVHTIYSTPSGKSFKPYQKGQSSQGGIKVQGFDTSDGEEHVWSALEEQSERNSFDSYGGSVCDRGRSVGERRFSGGGCGMSGRSGGCSVGRFGHLVMEALVE